MGDDRRSASLIAGLVLLLVVAGCRSAPAGVAASASAPVAGDAATRALQDLERFWAATYPTIAAGAAFTPLQGGYHPYTQADPPPDCGDEAGVYQPNAFYCPVGDFIAWDAEQLIPQMQSDFGELLVGLIMAHEYGHAVQARLGVTGQPTIVLEQQADCFAGAWLGEVLAGKVAGFPAITPEQLDSAIAGMLGLRDQVGTSAASPNAHGNAFDRIRALQDGVQHGAARCAGYRAGNLPVTQMPFTQERDAATGGNLPYQQTVETVVADAEEYWGRAFPRLAGQPWKTLTVRPFDTGAPPACPNPDSIAGGAAFYCPEGDFIAFDNAKLGPELHANGGDNAVGMLLGDLFARAAQHRRGAPTQDREGQLAVDCLAGSWMNDLLHRDRQTSATRLSPGDLDEAVAALLAFGRTSTGGGASGFDRIAAYRTGVLEGLAACR
jgi:predicted metalloprotease